MICGMLILLILGGPGVEHGFLQVQQMHNFISDVMESIRMAQIANK